MTSLLTFHASGRFPGFWLLLKICAFYSPSRQEGGLRQAAPFLPQTPLPLLSMAAKRPSLSNMPELHLQIFCLLSGCSLQKQVVFCSACRLCRSSGEGSAAPGLGGCWLVVVESLCLLSSIHQQADDNVINVNKIQFNNLISPHLRTARRHFFLTKCLLNQNSLCGLI